MTKSIRIGVDELKAAYEHAASLGVKVVEIESVDCHVGDAITVYGLEDTDQGWTRQPKGKNVTNYDNW